MAEFCYFVFHTDRVNGYSYLPEFYRKNPGPNRSQFDLKRRVEYKFAHES